MRVRNGMLRRAQAGISFLIVWAFASSAHTEEHPWLSLTFLQPPLLIIFLSCMALGRHRHNILTCTESASSILIGLKLLVASFTILIYCSSPSQLEPLPDGIATAAYRTGDWRYLEDANAAFQLSIHALSLNNYILEKIPPKLSFMPWEN